MSKKKFFSGNSLRQALLSAAAHFDLPPDDVAYREVEKKHGFLKVSKRVVIEVDAEDPRRPIAAAAAAPAAPPAAEPAAAPSRPRSPRPPRRAADAVDAVEPVEEDAGEEIAAAVAAAPAEEREEETPAPARGRARRPRTRGAGEEERSERPAARAATREEPAPEPEEESEEGPEEEPEPEEEAEDWEAGEGAADLEEDETAGAAAGTAAPAAGDEARRRRRRRRGGRGRGAGGERPAEAAGDDDLVALPERPRRPSERFAEASGPLADATRDAIDRILDVAGLDLGYTVLQGEDRLEVDLSGRDESLLVAEGGELLRAIEHLVPRVVRSLSGEPINVRVDAADFHEIHEEQLRTLAQRVASEVRRSERPRTLEPMSPADRRIVHITLADEPRVTSMSEGNGYFKRIVVKPA